MKTSTILNTLILAVLLLAPPPPAAAQTPPGLMNFQGRLTDASNNPLAGPHNFTFEIYDSLTGGFQLWTETQNGVTVVNGVLAAQLGASTALTPSVFTTSNAYLQITVDGVTLTPRQRLITSPYAFNAYSLGGRQYGAFVSTDAAAQSIAGDKTFTGSLILTGNGLSATQVRLSPGVVISSEASPAIGAGVRVSSNVFIVGFSSAAKYYGDGGGLYNVFASSLAADSVYAGALRDNSVTSPKIADGTIIAADIALSTISLDRLYQSGCTSGQVAKWNGSVWACSSVNNYTADEVSLHMDGSNIFSARASSVTLQGNIFNGVSQLVQLDSSGYLPALNGSLLTELTPANVANGTLGAGVIASSVGANGVRPGSIAAGAIVDADINAAADIAIGKLAVTGILGANVIVSSIAVGSVYGNALQDNTVTSAKIADGTIIAADIAVSTISLDRLNQSGCTSGQTAKWNGFAWACAADIDTNTTYTADEASLHLDGSNIFSARPSSVTLQGNTFNGASQLVLLDSAVRLPALDASLVLRVSSIAAGALTGSDQIVDGIIAGYDIAAATITLDRLNQSGCVNQQIPKWNGLAWTCANDRNNTYTADEITLHLNGANKFNAMGSSVTLQGNAFNGADQLVLLDAGTRLPAVDASLVLNVSSIAVNAIDSTSQIVDGTVSNADLAGSIEDGKLNQIATADKVALTALAAGTLATNVVASSVAANGVRPGSIEPGAIVDADINAAAAIAIGKLATTGTLGANVVASSIAVNAITSSAQIADGAIIAADIAVSTISLDRLNQSGCTSGQVAKWNGSAWACAADLSTPVDYGADESSLHMTAGGIFSARASSVTLQGNIFNGVSQLVQLDSLGYLPALNGSLLTSLTPANVADGTLGTGVIVSSVGAGGVRPGSIEAGAIVDADISAAAAIAIGKLAATGILGANVIVSSIAADAVYNGAIADNAVTSSKIADGTIIAADIAVSTISLDRLNQSGCTNGQIAKWNGSVWACAEDNNTPTAYTADETSLHMDGSYVFSARPSSVTLQGNIFNGVSQLVQLDGLGYLPALNGSLLTSLTPANVADGTLGTGVIVSSVGANGVRPGSIEAGAIADADISAAAAIAIGKLATTGNLGANVIVSSIAVDAVYNSAILDNAVTSSKIADGAIIAADIALSTISLDRLNQSGCASGETAKWNGSAWACAADIDTNTTYTADEASLHLDGSNIFSARPSSVTLQGNIFNGVSQLVQLDGLGFLPALNGSLLTSLTPANVADGTLGTGVIVSSVGANGVRPGSIEAGAIVDADINSAAAIAIGKLATTGNLGANVIVSSIAVGAVYNSAILDNAVTSQKIADGTIIAADIALSTISLDRLNQSGCSNGQIPKWNGSVWACAADNNTPTAYTADEASLHMDGSYVFSARPSSVTLQGNTFNGAGQLVLLDSGTRLPAVDASLVLKVSSIAINAINSTSQIVDGIVSNADLSGSIDDGKLNQIATADKVALTALAAGTLATNVVASSVAAAGVRPGSIEAGAIVDADINAAAAIAISKLATTGNLGANVIVSSIAASSIYTAALQDNAVTSAKIADGAIIAADIALSTISLDRLNQSGCASGQTAKWNGSAWACADDIDTNTAYTADETSLHLDGSNIFSAKASSVTLQGNIFNGAGQLVLLDSGTRLPAVDASLVLKVSSIAVNAIDSTSQIVDGIVSNADLAGSIDDGKLNQIATANK
ncbi:MAG TPA: hypothetical protein DCZ92_07480, partial [Elusimicrobia bacterium]|nr:hypothetical protein [Elusimicrobiota bacterium]